MGKDSDIKFVGDAMKELRSAMRRNLGVNCPMCRVKQPKRTPTILLPAQRCKVDGYTDPRPRSLREEFTL